MITVQIHRSVHLELLHFADVAHWSDAALVAVHVNVEQVALGVQLQGARRGVGQTGQEGTESA